MNVLLTGGAGFIGRWALKELIENGHQVTVLDDLSNSSLENIKEFEGRKGFKKAYVGTILDNGLLQKIFAEGKFDHVMHLAASINVQESIDNPKKIFDNDVCGTFNVLESARENGCSFLFMSTCMVYSSCSLPEGISETHPAHPASPYAAAKLAGENYTLSYFKAYGMKTLVVRPFNTYGPYQKSNMEGGVVPIFVSRAIRGEELRIYGDGTQTRDLLYVEDCARFLRLAAEKCHAGEVNGVLLNAGTGSDVTINALADLISGGKVKINHVAHIHPQSEIPKLLCDSRLASRILKWSPKFDLESGIAIMKKFLS
ncbi:MAG TPA: NAD-dependent epimerase/dehydratase family protein [Candidatus Wallbacteria bacterium]|nr:NAD-dependent epimerase/dehydratase family protein [Candidatus Wallbacteria bacterium]